MLVSQMRLAIKEKYNSPKWSTRVDSMPDKQVMAIYFRFENEKNTKQEQHIYKEAEQLKLF